MVRSKAGTAIFTCMDDDRTVRVRAADVEDADERTGTSTILMRGRAKDIGAKRVPVMPVVLEDTSALTRGSICSLIVADPIRINEAVYEGQQEINEIPHFRFHKGEIVFWTFQAGTYFIRIANP